MESTEITYKAWFETIKQKILSARLRAAVAVNAQLLEIYWELGKEIVAKQKNATWGDAVLEQLAADLRISFPDIKGFSKRNLYAIRQWYLFFSTKFTFVPQAVAQIPWATTGLLYLKLKV